MIFGFNPDHHLESMTEAAQKLEEQMEMLSNVVFDKVEILAHSIGGLVAKRQ